MICVVLSLVGCNKKAIDSSETLPPKVSNIEFWNGGTCIRKYSNVVIRAVYTRQILKTDIEYLVYEIQTEKGVEKIIDSESLAIVFSE